MNNSKIFAQLSARFLAITLTGTKENANYIAQLQAREGDLWTYFNPINEYGFTFANLVEAIDGRFSMVWVWTMLINRTEIEFMDEAKAH